MPKKTKLPDKPSALIRVALKDLMAVEKMKKIYEVNMGQWHERSGYDYDDKCHVCFAGSVIARSLKTEITLTRSPSDFNHDTSRKLSALDEFREGDIRGALETMDIGTPDYLHDEVTITDYDKSPAKFKKEMARMADVLEFFGV